jgi:fibronectin type 3 domain-containing protein
MTINHYSVYSQEGKVLVMNSDKESQSNSIYIKWFTQELLYEEGINIYRKNSTETNWVKLNSTPFKNGKQIDKTEFEKDSSLIDYIKLFKDTPKKDLKSIVLLNLLLKGIESDVFAGYLGIMFVDPSVSIGETYVYRIMKLTGNGESLIGISKEIKAGDFLPEASPMNIKISAGINRASMVWKPELERYYSVSIFRSSSFETIETQINTYPIMLSQKREKDGSLTIPEPYFTDDSLANNTTYYYRLQGRDFFGRKTEFSDVISVTIKDLLPPAPPYNLHPMQDNLKTTLVWKIQDSEDLIGFNVYKSTDDSLYMKINNELLNQTDTSFVDISPKDGTFFYYVTAADEAGNEARSPKLMVEIPDIVPPSKPTGLNAVADTGEIHLSWQSNREADLKGYLVYRRINDETNKEFALVFADPIKENSYSDRLSKIYKNRFEYVVCAIDSAYNVSAYSEIVTAQMPDILPPHKPKLIKTYLTDDQITVEWVPNLEPDLMGYQLFKKEKNDTGMFSLISKKLIDPRVNKYRDEQTESGKVYYYRLTAVDSSGNVSPLSEPFLGAFLRMEPSDSSDLKKISVIYQKNKLGVLIKWKTAEADDWKGCVVYRKTDTGEFLPLTGLIKSEHYFDEDIQADHSYQYQLRIYDQNGKVNRSEIREIITKE